MSSAGPGPAPEDLPPETLLVVLRGIGASMFLTDRHLIGARDGAERRPRSGFQAWTLDTIRHMRIELGSGPSGRIAVWTTGAQEALSMFFDARSLDRAHELLDIARPLIARSRRGRPGSEPARPSIGPARPCSSTPPGEMEPPQDR
jgi:alkanesulfonate monooxygenase SsuD/methylene tetrahydromethanopterin reductase-like flavin-dependent oxidoreductase (luciferase family)